MPLFVCLARLLSDMTKAIIANLVLLLFLSSVNATFAIEEIDRIRIAEAYRISERIQDQVWAGWSKAPFGILFITDDREFLIRHPKPNDEFASLGYDDLLKSEIFVRPRKFQKNLLATFPAFGSTPLVVIGKAENTAEKTSTRWVFVLLHEHFHQLQYSQPEYYSSVDALDLSGGDTSGMWQINYRFPYKNEKVAADFKVLSTKLLSAYNAKTKTQRDITFKEYIALRDSFKASLSPNDYRYAAFQIWQEGVSRYTQYKIAELAGKRVKPSEEFRKLPDYVSFKQEADRLLAATLRELKEFDLRVHERTMFYPFGAVEALMLDRLDSKWRSRYLKERFELERFYPPRNPR